MKTGRQIGVALLVAAFGFAAAETAAQGIAGLQGVMSAYTVLHTLIPGELIQTKIIIQKNLHPVLWDPFIRGLLWLPGWLTLGAPGAYLFWKFRDEKPTGDEADDDFPNSTYDDILAAAEELDEHMELDGGNAPSKYENHAEFDPAALHDETGGLDGFEIEPEQLERPKKP